MGRNERGDDTVITSDDTVIAAEDTVITSDDTIIAIDDTVLGVISEETIIEPDVDDTALGARPALGATPAQISEIAPPPAEKESALAPTQPIRRVGDRPTAPKRATVAYLLRFVSGARYELTSPVIVGRSPRIARLSKND